MFNITNKGTGFETVDSTIQMHHDSNIISDRVVVDK